MIGQNDFIVDWKENCFICWEQIPIQLPSAALDPFPVYSLQCLSRYLEIDMSKVFHSESSRNPLDFPDLLAMVQKSKLKVGLCSECALVNSRLSELYRQLEEIEMKTASCIQLIHSKLERAEEAKETQEIEMMTDSDSFTVGKLQIVKSLGKETMQKCSRKLKKLLPKVRIQNLTLKEVIAEKNKFNCSTVQSPGTFAVEKDIEQDNLQELEWEGVKNEKIDLDELQMTSSFANLIPDIDSNEDEYSSDFTEPYAVLFKSETSEKVKLEALENSTPYLEPAFPKPVGRPKCTFNPKTGNHAKVRYRCTLCKNEFSNLSNYRRHHQSVHTGVRFKCHKCNRQFTQKGHLKRHAKGTGCGKDAG